MESEGIVENERGKSKLINDSIKTTDISVITVSATVLGDIIGVSDRRIRQLAEEGVLIRAAKGRYKLYDSIKNYILTVKVANDSNASETADGELDIDREKALHERVNRHIAELKLALMKGEVHKSEDVERVMADMLSSFKTRLLALPAKISPILVARTDAGNIKDVLLGEVNNILNEFKEYNPEDFYGKEYIDLEE